MRYFFRFSHGLPRLSHLRMPGWQEHVLWEEPGVPRVKKKHWCWLSTTAERECPMFDSFTCIYTCYLLCTITAFLQTVTLQHHFIVLMYRELPSAKRCLVSCSASGKKKKTHLRELLVLRNGATDKMTFDQIREQNKQVPDEDSRPKGPFDSRQQGY